MPYSSKVPTQGIIRLSQLQEEYGGNNPISLGEYYRNGSYVTDIGVNSGVPTSGQTSMSLFYGTAKSVTPAITTSYTVPGTYTYEVPATVSSLDISVKGGGSSTTTTTNAIPVTPGDLVSIQIGTAGSASTTYPVTYGVYPGFLNAYGIWNSGMSGDVFDQSWNVYFPTTGLYVITATADNAHAVQIDGNTVNSGGDWGTVVTTTYSVTQGIHSVRVYAEDWGMPASVGVVISEGWDYTTGQVFTTRNPNGTGTASSATVAGRTVNNAGGFGTNVGQVSITAHGTTTYSTSGVYTYTVPTGTTSVSIAVTGAGGGGGGSDSGGPGGPGGAGTTVSGTLSVTGGDVLTLYIGGGGSAGWGCVAGSGGGAAGISQDPGGYAGGRGGNAGGGGCSGGAAGGGAATTLWKNGTRLVVAGGGGGGGGGSWNRSAYPGLTNTGGSGSINGAAGADYGGDGGGGGGGGVDGGYGGSGGGDNSVGGQGGGGGTSLVPSGWTSANGLNGAAAQSTNGGAGRVTISF